METDEEVDGRGSVEHRLERIIDADDCVKYGKESDRGKKVQPENLSHKLFPFDRKA
jgi:hypothetical protein